MYIVPLELPVPLAKINVQQILFCMIFSTSLIGESLLMHHMVALWFKRSRRFACIEMPGDRLAWVWHITFHMMPIRWILLPTLLHCSAQPCMVALQHTPALTMEAALIPLVLHCWFYFQVSDNMFHFYLLLWPSIQKRDRLKNATKMEFGCQSSNLMEVNGWKYGSASFMSFIPAGHRW